MLQDTINKNWEFLLKQINPMTSDQMIVIKSSLLNNDTGKHA